MRNNDKAEKVQNRSRPKSFGTHLSVSDSKAFYTVRGDKGEQKEKAVRRWMADYVESDFPDAAKSLRSDKPID